MNIRKAAAEAWVEFREPIGPFAATFGFGAFYAWAGVMPAIASGNWVFLVATPGVAVVTLGIIYLAILGCTLDEQRRAK